VRSRFLGRIGLAGIGLAGELLAGDLLSLERLPLNRLARELLLDELAGTRPGEPRARRAVTEARDSTLGCHADGTGEGCSPTLLLAESGLPVSGVGEFRATWIGLAGNTGETGFLSARETGNGDVLVAGAGEAWVR
jgi:hypothetical protein